MDDDGERRRELYMLILMFSRRIYNSRSSNTLRVQLRGPCPGSKPSVSIGRATFSPPLRLVDSRVVEKL